MPADGLASAIKTKFSTSLVVTDVTYRIDIPEFRVCEHAHIEITPEAGGVALSPSVAADIDLAALPFTASLTIYTTADGLGTACDAKAADASTCVRKNMRLPVTVNAARTAFVVKVFPDPAATHYVVSFKVICFI